jgi:hypothetical protein
MIGMEAIESTMPFVATHREDDRIVDASTAIKSIARFLLRSLVVLAAAGFAIADAQVPSAPSAMAQGETTGNGSGSFVNAPQEFVVCTGWHALCTASPDCRLNGDKADCDCMRVDETHIVETSAIVDAAAKRMTRIRCTAQHPCDVDEAPVCEAIRSGNYEVHDVKYDWVSTYSYRGWCSILTPDPIACDQGTAGYSGDLRWAACDAAPCTENPNPSDPERPLTCRCPVQDSAFVGPKGSCTGQNGGIISSFPMSSWDFQNKTYTFPMPGYEWVRGACAALKSDP